MITVSLLCLILAAIAFIVACFNARLPWMPIGLFLLTLAFIVEHLGGS